jgi:catechol 2,3-dioxygenase-like lactoylglutathione lyase family enzyme
MDKQLVGWVQWVGIVTDNLDAQRQFYGEVLGLKELAAYDDFVYFDFGWPRILEIKRRSAAPGEQTGCQVGFMVGDIHSARKILADRGADLLDEVEGGAEFGGYWCRFQDSDGNIFQVQQRLGPPWPLG